MATPSRGERATPRRVAELQAQLAELEGHVTGRLDVLERDVRRLMRSQGVGDLLARALVQLGRENTSA